MDLKVSEILSAKLQESQPVFTKQPDLDFTFTLNKLGEEGLSARLAVLIEEIRTQGKKIAEHADIRDLKNYRTLIAEFVNEIVTNSHHFSRENFLDRRGRHRVYGIVKLVNKDLDELAQELLKSERNNIKILDKIGHIHGLLLDMMV